MGKLKHCASSFSGLLLGAALVSSALALDPAFHRWVQDLWPDAQTLGVSRRTFEDATRGLEPDFTLPDLDLPGSEGTWMIVKGGMGTVTKTLSQTACKAGAEIITGKKVTRIDIQGGVARGVTLVDGSTVQAKAVVVNADPFRLQALAGTDHLPASYNSRIENYRRPGSTFKVNLALKGLPKFTCLSEDRGQYGTTIHLLPDEQEVVQSLREGFNAVKEGKLYPFPTIEWYIHTTIDPSLRDAGQHHNSALFVQWVPYELKGTTWEAEEERYVNQLLSICDRFAPGTSDLLVGISIHG